MVHQNSGNYGIVDPTSVNLNTADPRDIVCYLAASGNEYNGDIGIRIAAIFVVLITSTCTTFFPVLATRNTRFKIPIYVYLFARYFGAGVIIATAFIHLLDPAYAEIGPNTCVGMTGGWAGYAWPPAIALTTAMFIFLMQITTERLVEKKFALPHAESTGKPNRSASVDAAMIHYDVGRAASTHATHQALHSGDQDNQFEKKDVETTTHDSDSIDSEKDRVAEVAFRQQITAFMILEFGVLFHSVIIGLALGTAGAEFNTLFPVIIFHQAFEGLGIGARLSAIPFPKRLKWMPYALCTGYGLCTPIAIAAAIGVRTTYNANSYTANVVSGVLDASSAGILMYTGFVELIARDFLFNPDRPDDDRQLAFMVCTLLLGAGIMALLGKWA